MLSGGRAAIPPPRHCLMSHKKALSELDPDREITVSTFCENDARGAAPRALYRKFGFREGALTVEFGCPNQVFILPPRA